MHCLVVTSLLVLTNTNKLFGGSEVEAGLFAGNSVRRERIKGKFGYHTRQQGSARSGRNCIQLVFCFCFACWHVVSRGAHIERGIHFRYVFLSGIAYLGLRRGRSNRLGGTPLQDTHAAHTLLWEVCSKSSAIL
uniref:(northern house mosquito) hypothetical protein n=1 Tax=Culex pipiens TaxID=7175 RepID=A0A8D8GLW7_CULPI